VERVNLVAHPGSGKTKSLEREDSPNHQPPTHAQPYHQPPTPHLREPVSVSQREGDQKRERERRRLNMGLSQQAGACLYDRNENKSRKEETQKRRMSAKELRIKEQGRRVEGRSWNVRLKEQERKRKGS